MKRDGDGKGDVFEDSGNDGAGAKNDTLDFSDGATDGVTRAQDGDGKGSL